MIENVKEDADIEIEGRITVVDGKKAKMYLDNFGEFFENQVEHASTIVISRTQNMTDEKIEACVHLLREKNDKATIISTPWNQLSGDCNPSRSRARCRDRRIIRASSRS